MRLCRKFSIVFIISLLSGLNLSGKDVFYKSISSAEGLPSSVSSIYAEPSGYVWVGTYEGLIRIGNTGTKVYRADGKPNSLPSDMIYAINTDNIGLVWILTDKGVIGYNHIKDNFEVPFDPVPMYSSLRTDNALFYGGDNCIYKHSFDDHFISLVKEFETPSPYSVDAIFDSGDGNFLLFNKSQGFLVYNPATGSISSPAFNFKDSYCAFVDSSGRIWRSRYNRGLECYDMRGELLRTFSVAEGTLSSDVVLCITEHDGDIWVGTDGGGIDILDTYSNTMRVLSHGTRQVCTLPDNSIAVIHCAQNGDVWAARAEGGLLLLKDSYMRSFFIRPSGIKTDNASDKVNCIIKQDGGNVLWLGTHGSGLIRFIPEDESIFSYPETEGMEVVSIVNLPGRKLLLSCINRGLFVFDTESGTLTDFPYNDKELQDWMKYSGSEVNLSLGYQGNVVIFADAVYIFNPYTGSMQKMGLADSFDGKMDILPITGSDGRFFICENRILMWSTSANEVRVFHDAGEGVKFSCGAQDDNGVIWLASNKGLGCLSVASGSYTHIDSEFFESANSVSCSSNGNVWVGTNGKLFVYLKNRGSFVVLDEYDGVYSNNFMPKAVAMVDGQIAMGGTNGIVMIDPNQPFDNEDNPVLSISDFLINGQRIPYDGRFVVRHSGKNIVINVIARESDFFRSKNYKFKLDSPRGTSEYVSSTPSFPMGFGQAGHYTVFACCTLRDGSWSDYYEIADFQITKHWNQTWWFILLVVTAVLLILAAVIRVQTVMAREKQKAETTQKDVRFLLNVSHELKTPLTLIINPLKRIIQNTAPDNPDYGRLKNMLRQAQRMKTLILTVLSAHKIEEGSAVLEAEPVDFNYWVSGIAEDFRDEAESQGTRFVTDFDQSIEQVDLDEAKLVNVLTNILINAFKHSPEKSEIIVGTKALDKGRVRFFVKDRGQGLGGVDMTKLFNRYYQGVTEKTGSGMGLAYARTIVELHHGEMGAKDNDDGAGATFFFDIPVKQ